LTELERTREQLAELDRMRAFFLGLASHDLKTPLAVAVNYVQTILDGYAGEVLPKQRHWLERTQARLEELLQLINDFLDVSLLDAQRIAQEMEPTCLTTVAQLALEDVAARAKEKAVTVSSQVPANLSMVHGSPKRLRRLLVNLLDNGIKFTPQGGQVTLTAIEEADHVRIDVLDTGVGIPSSYLPHIFEDYFRVRQREFIPGAGLGLSTARRIVEAHGGKIWVESPYRSDASGSKFSCTLPKSRSNA
jgi:two-component system phosphate regulon sensor histidine kinase PhoR